MSGSRRRTTGNRSGRGVSEENLLALRRGRSWFPAAACGLVAVVLVALVVVAVVKAPRDEPAPEPAAVVQPWCVDPVTMTLFAEQRCTEDVDLDGFVDGHLYVPVRGLVKPKVGAKLPPAVKFDGPVVRIPVRPAVPPPAPPVQVKVPDRKATPPRAPSGRKFG